MIFVAELMLRQESYEGKTDMLTKENFETGVRVAYAALIVLFVVMIGYMVINEHIVFNDTRSTNDAEILTGYTTECVTDETAPAGVIERFIFPAGSLPPKDTDFMFQSRQRYVHISLDGETIYELLPTPGDPVTISVGNSWIFLDLNAEDMDKELVVELIPTYKGVVSKSVTFYSGNQLVLLRRLFSRSVPAVIVGVLIFFTGIIFFSISIKNILQVRHVATRLYYLGMFSMIIGVWRIFDTDLSSIMFAHHPVFVANIALVALWLLPTPLLLGVRYSIPSERFYLSFPASALHLAVGFGVLLAQLTGLSDMRNDLTLCHITTGIRAGVLLFSLITFLAAEKDDRRFRLYIPVALFGAVCMVIDFLFYYAYGDTDNLIFTMLAFLLIVIGAGRRSINSLSARAVIDARTGIHNRNSCDDVLDRKGKTFHTALIMVDLNDLKVTNDTLGHDAGDKLIENFARIFRDTMPASAFLGRYGGDEFIALLNGVSKEKVNDLLKNLRTGVDEYNKNAQPLSVSYCAGCAFSEDHNEEISLRSLFKEADERMYDEKKAYHAAD